MNSLIFKVILVACLYFLGTSDTPKEFVTLQAKTPISFILKENIYSDKLKKGQTIFFIVQNSVFVDGKIVIRSGTIAEGRVKGINLKANGNCKSFAISMERVQAVDGQIIYVRSLPYIKQRIEYKEHMNLCKALTIHRGTLLKGIVLGDTDILF